MGDNTRSIAICATRARIVEAASELLTDRASYDAMAEAVNPYGDGQAAERILDRIREHFAELVAGASNASP
ncbi:UDP-N-acetylglucosamine 2-epimerase [Phycisphaerales bacterium AB-hyl4]|uniref:UDP-N-acetylglucosamine 2-epimerase n=1 Tax=Natronomicrosphaera hydrolytica TaxID=3242702 RepID=A0ABV4U814_9BACT